MAKKKLLSEAQVRRFMGLAGMNATMVSNVINEMGSYMEKDEDPADAEPPMGDMPEPADDMPEPAGDMPEPADDMAGDELDDGDLDLEPSEIKDAFAGMEKAMAIINKLNDAVGEEGDDMPEPEMDDAPEMDDEEDMEEGMYKRDKDEEDMEEGMYKRDKDEEKVMDEELSEVDLQLSEEEIVQEVARRVAKRIIKAKRAKKALDEALGKK